MEPNNAFELYNRMEGRLAPGDYNYDHFSRHAALQDVRNTYTGRGIGAGCEAPDFELEDSDGNRLRLSALRGNPVLLRFGSYS